MHEQTDGRAEEERRSGPSPTLIAAIVIVVLVAIFIVQNGEKRTIELLFIDITAPVWLGFAIALVLGALLDRLITMWWRRRKRKDA